MALEPIVARHSDDSNQVVFYQQIYSLQLAINNFAQQESTTIKAKLGFGEELLCQHLIKQLNKIETPKQWCILVVKLLASEYSDEIKNLVKSAFINAHYSNEEIQQAIRTAQENPGFVNNKSAPYLLYGMHPTKLSHKHAVYNNLYTQLTDKYLKK